MKNSQESYIYSEKDWRLIEGPFVVEQRKWLRSLKKRARSLRRKFFEPQGRIRERIVEIPLTLAAMSKLSSGSAVADVGGALSLMGLQMVYLGHKVHVLDLRPYPLKHGDLRVQQLDLFDNDLPKNHFDAISCISVIEHVGLVRYGGQAESDRDMIMMEEFRRLCRPGGLVVVSGPYGKGHDPDKNGTPKGYRIYNKKRLGRLCEGYEVDSLRFFVMENGAWVEKSQEEADRVETSRPIDAIFFAELRNPKKGD